jgi:DNA-directed RNA polymerase subunit RPC12/RpoP
MDSIKDYMKFKCIGCDIFFLVEKFDKERIYKCPQCQSRILVYRKNNFALDVEVLKERGGKATKIKYNGSEYSLVSKTNFKGMK